MVLLSQLRNAAKRIPMIKFRAGHKFDVQPTSHEAVAPSPSSAKVKTPAIDDWQLPARYRRRPIDIKEIDAINSGGAY